MSNNPNQDPGRAQAVATLVNEAGGLLVNIDDYSTEALRCLIATIQAMDPHAPAQGGDAERIQRGVKAMADTAATAVAA